MMPCADVQGAILFYITNRALSCCIRHSTSYNNYRRWHGQILRFGNSSFGNAILEITNSEIELSNGKLPFFYYINCRC